ncbi:MAG: right-handed parallel beta-helix repeat-containing protein [Clostridia bacterium]|nr:right-handed parallel beta-helix repeat-containing protein [Clostridia bacterium]
MRLYVTELGAIGDGVTSNTAIFNEAVVKVAEAGGGQVVVPAGTYISGTIKLLSNVHLYLEAGAKILGAEQGEFVSIKGDSTPALIVGDSVDNVGVEGHGIVEINGTYPNRPYVILMNHCTNVTVRDVSLYDHGGYWVTLHNMCENVTLDSIIIDSRGAENGDGLDFWGSKNVTISNCKINAGDDAISLKTGPNEPCINFMITNCVFSSDWAGIRIGPESWGDMRNITISNCVFNDCSDALKIQLVTECQMEDITFSNLVIVNTCRALCMTYSPELKYQTRKDQFYGKMRRMMFSNIICKNGGRSEHQRFHEEQMIIQGMPGAPIEDLSFDNVQFICSGGGVVDEKNGILVPEHCLYENFYPEFLPRELHADEDNHHPAACMYINHANRIKFTNCNFDTVATDGRPAIVANDVHNAKFLMCSTNVEAGLLRYYDVDGLSVIACDGSVEPISDAMAKQCDEFKAFTKNNIDNIVNSERYKKELGSMDHVISVPHEEGQGITVPSFMYHHEKAVEKTYLNLGNMKGSPRVMINGKEVFFWDRGNCPAYNYGRVPLVIDISDTIEVGDNEIEILLEGALRQFRSPTFDVYTSKQ